MDRLSESSLRIRAAASGTLRKRVLVASPDHGLRHLLVSVLKRMDFEVVESGLDRESRERVTLLPGSRARRRIDIALIDARAGGERIGVDRDEAQAALDAISPLVDGGETVVLVIAKDDATATLARERGATVLRPPITAASLRAALTVADVPVGQVQ